MEAEQGSLVGAEDELGGLEDVEDEQDSLLGAEQDGLGGAEPEILLCEGLGFLAGVTL